jgi:N-acetylmuramoyl-L-alanine amidase
MKHWIQGLLAAAVLLAPVHAETLEVTDVRFWSLGDVTRIAIEVSGEFLYSKDRLPNPERLFFDFKGARSSVDGKPYRIVPVGDGLVRQIRIAPNGQINTRVVLDLSEPGLEYSVSQLSVPDRLMIELRRKAESPAAEPSQQLARPSALDAVEAPAPAAASKVFQPPPEHVRLELPASWIDIAAPPALGAKKNSIPLEPARMARAKFPPRPAGVAATVIEEPFASPAKNKESGNSMTRALGLKIRRVVIDPGHGGRDEGSRGPTGLKEKDLVLDISKRLGELVEQATGAEVVFTRDEDHYVPLERRTQIANEHRADLFLSIHANSSSLKIATGVESYYLSFTTSKSAMELAAKENAGSERSVFELKELLQKIALKDKVDESRDFAVKVQSSLFSLASKNNPTLRNRGVKKAPFIVLIGTQMPSVLAEIGFVSNPKEEVLLKTAAHRQKIAEALLKGMEGYLSTLSHYQLAGGKSE